MNHEARYMCVISINYYFSEIHAHAHTQAQSRTIIYFLVLELICSLSWWHSWLPSSHLCRAAPLRTLAGAHQTISLSLFILSFCQAHRHSRPPNATLLSHNNIIFVFVSFESLSRWFPTAVHACVYTCFCFFSHVFSQVGAHEHA